MIFWLCRYLRFVSFGDNEFSEYGGPGMEATASGSKRILECAEEAKSPHRILVRSLLKSRNKLRAKYRELRAECKRWRNQAAAVEKSRSAWRQRALRGEAALPSERAERGVLDAPVQELREPSPRPRPSASSACDDRGAAESFRQAIPQFFECLLAEGFDRIFPADPHRDEESDAIGVGRGIGRGGRRGVRTSTGRTRPG